MPNKNQKKKARYNNDLDSRVSVQMSPWPGVGGVCSVCITAGTGVLHLRTFSRRGEDDRIKPESCRRRRRRRLFGVKLGFPSSNPNFNSISFLNAAFVRFYIRDLFECSGSGGETVIKDDPLVYGKQIIFEMYTRAKTFDTRFRFPHFTRSFIFRTFDYDIVSS